MANRLWEKKGRYAFGVREFREEGEAGEEVACGEEEDCR